MYTDQHYAAKPYQEYPITTNSSTAVLKQLIFDPITLENSKQEQYIFCEAVGDTITVAFGGSGVVASNTVATNSLPTGNFTLTEGIVYGFYVRPSTENFISALGNTGAGLLRVRLCRKPT
jgi:hypothetical protein